MKYLILIFALLSVVLAEVRFTSLSNASVKKERKKMFLFLYKLYTHTAYINIS